MPVGEHQLEYVKITKGRQLRSEEAICPALGRELVQGLHASPAARQAVFTVH